MLPGPRTRNQQALQLDNLRWHLILFPFALTEMGGPPRLPRRDHLLAIDRGSAFLSFFLPRCPVLPVAVVAALHSFTLLTEVALSLAATHHERSIPSQLLRKLCLSIVFGTFDHSQSSSGEPCKTEKRRDHRGSYTYTSRGVGPGHNRPGIIR